MTRPAKSCWKFLRFCTSSRQSLGVTLWFCSTRSTALVLAFELVFWTIPTESLSFDERSVFALFQSLVRPCAIIWCGLCVMHACVCRTGTRKSIIVSGFVFLLSSWGTLEATVFLATDTSTVVKKWYEVRTNGWTPLSVIADPYLGRIVVSGDITQDSDRLFESVVRANPALNVVQIESYGGYVYEALKMARLIRSLRLDTVSMRRCASACTLVFVAGKNRYLGPDARFRFHRAGYTGMPAGVKLEELDQELALFYTSMGASPEIPAGELATPFHSFWEPTQGFLFASNYATLRWSERPPGT